MTSTSSRPIARLSSPGDIVATVPTLCGFPPHESIVLLSLRGRRRRVGLTIRLDLPPATAELEVAQLLAGRLAQDGATAAVVIVYAATRRADLVEAVLYSCQDSGIDVGEVLHVDEGRWTSYLCCGPCCPPEGTPLPPVPELVEAHSALDGRAVLASRDELVRSLAAPTFVQAEQCAQELDRATVAWVAACDRDGVAAARQAALQHAATVLGRVASGAPLELPGAAGLAVALHDVLVRDEVATWELARSDELLSMLEQLCRLTPPPFDAPVCTLLAWVSYARGDGSRANIGLDRALRTDPGYSLALLLRSALDGALPPSEVRALLRQTAVQISRRA